MGCRVRMKNLGERLHTLTDWLDTPVDSLDTLLGWLDTTRFVGHSNDLVAHFERLVRHSSGIVRHFTRFVGHFPPHYILKRLSPSLGDNRFFSPALAFFDCVRKRGSNKRCTVPFLLVSNHPYQHRQQVHATKAVYGLRRR